MGRIWPLDPKSIYLNLMLSCNSFIYLFLRRSYNATFGYLISKPSAGHKSASLRTDAFLLRGYPELLAANFCLLGDEHKQAKLLFSISSKLGCQRATKLSPLLRFSLCININGKIWDWMWPNCFPKRLLVCHVLAAIETLLPPWLAVDALISRR